MTRKYEELNKLEQIGLTSMLIENGWEACTLHSPEGKTKSALTIKIKYGNKVKNITVELRDFHVDED